MKINEFAILPVLSETTDTYDIETSLSSFGIPFDEDNNTEVLFQTIMNETDGYRGALIQKIKFKNTIVGITYQAGRDGRDNYGYFVINPKLFKEMILSLQQSTLRSDFEEIQNQSDYEFNELYNYDLSKILNKKECL